MMKYLTVAVLCMAITMTGAIRASAHAFLDSATPKVGATVKAAPKTIRLRFTQRVEPAFSHIRLETADGTPIETGKAAIDPSDSTILVAAVTGKTPPGSYEVRWDVVSVDTHHSNGHFPFTYQP
jgi:methionine-rich copper-binding protein CopC